MKKSVLLVDKEKNVKKKFVSKHLAWLLFVMTVTQTGPAWAGAGLRIFNSDDSALLKKLEEKGVLTKDDVKDIEKEEKKSGKNHSLNLSTRLQFLYTFKTYENKAGKDDVQDFNIRRMRFQADGNMFKDVDYKFEFNADKMKSLSMKDAWVGLKHLKYARFRIGQFKSPFSRQRITSSSKLQIIERSPIQILYPGRDMGIEMSGKNIGKMFDYAVALLSGVGNKRQFHSTDNEYFLTDGRVAFHPLGEIKHSEGDTKHTDNFRFELAGNFLFAPHQKAFGEEDTDTMFNNMAVYGVSNLADLPEGDTVNVGPEFSVVYKGFSLLSEAYWAQFMPDWSTYDQPEHGAPSTKRDIKTFGAFVQGGAFIIPKTLELAGRFDYLDVDTKQFNDGDDLRSYTGGINYYIHGHKYKLQANYVKNEYDGKLEKNNSLIRVNLQVKY
ncbi:MAG: porin [bacterium]